MTRGKYIVLEGPEGVGKTTQMQELERRLRLAGLPVRVLREPDSLSDLAARAIRRLTQDPRYPLNTAAEVLLYNAARAQSLQVIKNSIEHGVTCLVDRNYLTTLAIQYYGRGDVPDYDTINRIIEFAVQGIEPDLCIVLDAPTLVLMDRQKHRSHGERFDDLDAVFLDRVRAGYLWEAKQRNLPVVFADSSSDEVANTIWKLVIKTLATRGQKSLLASESATLRQSPISHEPPIRVSEAEAPEFATEAEQTVDTSKGPVTKAAARQTYYVSQLLASRLRIAGLALPGTTTAGEDLRYYIPDDLDTAAQQAYKQTLDEILSQHTAATKQLTDYLSKTSALLSRAEAAQEAQAYTRALLPLAVLTGIELRPQTSGGIPAALATEELPEADRLAVELPGKNNESQQTHTAMTAANDFKNLARSYTTAQYANAAPETVTLSAYWPRNELDILADALYEHSGESLGELKDSIACWSYEQKVRVYTVHLEACSHIAVPTSALSKMSYTWDILSDYSAFLDFARLGLDVAIATQALTPRNGYDIPTAVEAAGLSDAFEHCFDLSLELYSTLQQAGHAAEAQYATLQGHRLRWSVTCSARDVIYLCSRQSPAHSRLQWLFSGMQQGIAEVHPLLAQQLASINGNKTTLSTSESSTLRPVSTSNQIELTSADSAAV